LLVFPASPAKSKRAGRNSQKAPSRERSAEDRLDPGTEGSIGVADPRNLGVHVERHVELTAAGRAQDDPRLAREERGATIVRVAGHGRGLAALGEDAVEEGPQVGVEAVVPRDELVELAAGRDVLIFETGRAPGRERPDERAHELLLQRGDGVARAGKKARE